MNWTTGATIDCSNCPETYEPPADEQSFQCPNCGQWRDRHPDTILFVSRNGRAWWRYALQQTVILAFWVGLVLSPLVLLLVLWVAYRVVATGVRGM